MSTSVNSTHTSVPASSRTPTIPATESPYTNGHHHHHMHEGGAQSGAANMGKKGKQKKATDPTEASNLIAAKISQLESDAAGDKEQEAEIGGLCHPICHVCADLIAVRNMQADLPEIALRCIQSQGHIHNGRLRYTKWLCLDSCVALSPLSFICIGSWKILMFIWWTMANYISHRTRTPQICTRAKQPHCQDGRLAANRYSTDSRLGTLH